MRKIKRTKRFKRDYKREKSGRHGKTLEAILRPVLELLVVDSPLPQRACDHSLTGDWVDHRNCHIKPDLVLIYRKSGDDCLDLVRLGSHSELDL
ncbi:MAG: type II toxin-antitoxin system YafQ family toxin [Alphaproteobacteria bacterium]|nr:type II toxin-antitoxin system YafQ family toxin [Alphaproteobacteria bacterium]